MRIRDVNDHMRAGCEYSVAQAPCDLSSGTGYSVTTMFYLDHHKLIRHLFTPTTHLLPTPQTSYGRFQNFSCPY